MVNKYDITILLNRRKEIREQINKLEAEYQSLGRVLLQLHNYEHPTGIGIEMEIQRLQKIQAEENKLSGREK